MDGVTVLIVNYNTPDLLEAALRSVRQFYEDVPVLVVDGSDRQPFKDQSAAVAGKFWQVTFQQLGFNIHHGPGIEHGMYWIETPFTFVMDSDAEIVKAGVLEEMCSRMKPETYACGQGVQVDVNGENDNGGGITYIHPFAMMIQQSTFDEYPKPHRHGAPMINPMRCIQRAGLSEKVLSVWNEVTQYVRHPYWGTRARFGLQWEIVR